MARGYQDGQEGGLVKLTDFRLAGFLIARGLTMLSAETNSRQEVVFVFDAIARAVLVEYPGSVEQRYDAACKATHGIVRATLGGRHR